MYSIFDIANEILVLCKKRVISVSPMKLTKLTYVAFGWYAGLHGRKLFSSRIEAWKYGPVMPDLYHATKKYGRIGIPDDLIPDRESLDDPEIRDFLEEIVEKYGEMSAIRLSSITHLPDSPWREVYDRQGSGKEIPFELIRRHYARKLDDRDTAAAGRG